MRNFLRIFKVMWLFVGLIAIGWGVLPFILANATGLAWLAWFGIITIPSGLAAIVIMFLQKSILTGGSKRNSRRF